MDKPACGGGPSCCDPYRERIRKLVGDMNGSVESFYQDAPAPLQHLKQCGGGGDQGRKDKHHRVTLSLLLPCGAAGSGSGPRGEGGIQNRELNGGGAMVIPGDGGYGGDGDGDYALPNCQGPDSDSSGEESIVSCCTLGSSTWGDEEGDPLEYADIMPEAELNEILDSFMENSEELEAYTGGGGDLVTVTNEQLLHAAVDKHLSQSSSSSSKSSASDWESPLFDDVEDVGDVAAVEELEPVQIKEEPAEDEGQSEGEEDGEEEGEMDMSNPFPVQVQTLPQGLNLPREQFIPSSSISGCSFATLTTVSAPPNPQPIRQQFIPQVTVPMSAVSQVAYAMATAASKNQILRPATLPPMSALVNGGGFGMYPLNWALAQNSFEIPASIMRINPKPADSYVPSRHQVLLTRASSSVADSTRPSLPAIVTRIRCRKTTPVPIKEIKNLTVARAHKEEVISQFAKLQNVGEGPGIPDGHTFESWILEEGLHKTRKLGLHQAPGADDYPFKCPLCDKKYRNPNGIKYHAKYGHGPKCTFTCPTCQRDYATRHGLAAHRRTHLLTDEVANLESTIQAGPGRG